MASENFTDTDLISWTKSCKDEADFARRDRMDMNKKNFNMYHLKHDFSHKQEGQTTDVLSKQAMAVEQTAAFFGQALCDAGDWWKVEAQKADEEPLMKIKPHEIMLMTNRQLERNDFYTFIANGVKSGLLGSLIITKMYGCRVTKPKFIAKDKKTKDKTVRVLERVDSDYWQLHPCLVRQENYYPDPTGEGLYEIEEMWMDFHEIEKLSQGEYAIYDSAAVAQLSKGSSGEGDNEYKKNRETAQNATNHGHRRRIKLTEFWGNVLDKTGKVVHENCVYTIADDRIVIRKPEPNPYWHQKSPYIVTPIIEVPHSVWHKALADAGTQHNMSLNEIYNLLVDSAMKAVHGVSQVRVDWLEDVSQVSSGIRAGTALKVNAQCPPGAKVAEPIITSQTPPDVIQTYNIMNQEFNASMLTNDLRQGVMPFRQVKATEVVEASQTITSVFEGITKNIELKWITPMLEMAWQLIAQYADDLYDEEVVALLGEKRAGEIQALPAEDRFASTVSGLKFRVYGVTLQLNRQADYKKYITLLQTIGSSEVLMESFSQKYDITKLLEEIISSLNLDKYKIQRSEAEIQAQNPQAQTTVPGEAPDDLSQVPQGSALSLNDLFGGPSVPHTEFPGSPALAGGNQ